MLLLFTQAHAQTPRVFAHDAQQLAAAKTRVQKQDAALLPALKKVRKDADAALTLGPFTVTAKQRVPPSGDKHDYLTLAPYWWPDPTKPDGLPYIRRDGETNPESKRDTDGPVLVAMTGAVESLAFAYYFTGEERYAERAALLLRTWFIAPATKMNPNYEYAQAVPGHNSGRGAGLIDARNFIRVVDAVGLLAGSPAWTKADQQGLTEWCRAFTKWLQTSANGKEEAAARNNHGTWLAATLTALALFSGDEALARKTVEGVKARIAWQIQPDGQQPLELERTRAWSYSLFNLEALVTAANLGEKAGVNLWTYETKDGRGLRRVFEQLGPYAFGEKKWPHPQITAFTPDEYFAALRQAAPHYPDEKFRALAGKLPLGKTERLY